MVSYEYEAWLVECEAWLVECEAWLVMSVRHG